MKPGRELDALIAEKVMGITPDLKCIACGSTNLLIHWLTGNNMYGDCTKNMDYKRTFIKLPNYSTDISDAWLVVEKMGAYNDSSFSLSVGLSYTEWCACFMGHKAWSDSAPHAICLAALKAVGVEVENE